MSYPCLQDKEKTGQATTRYLKAEFIRIIGMDMVDCLEKFWTARRVDIALPRLLADKVARDMAAEQRQQMSLRTSRTW